MEIWDVYDKNRVKTDKKVVRGNPMKPGEYHIVVHVWLINDKKELLISQRTPNKTYPNMWECTGGSAVEGDTSKEAAIREVEEELGIDVSNNNCEMLYTDRRELKDFPDFRDVWLFRCNVDIEAVSMQVEEVQDAKWATMEEIKEMIEDGLFVNHFSYLDELFDHIEKMDL